MKKTHPIVVKPSLLLVTFGSLTALLGGVVLVGWYLRIPTLVQVFPQFVPMQYNTALGFFLCGAGLLLVQFNKPRLAGLLGGLAAVVGILTIIEYGFGANLGIDQLLMKHYITVQTSHPGRMAPNTALGFFLTGSALLAMGWPLLFKRQSTISGLLGSITVALGAIAFFGYLFGFPATYGWGQLTKMAAHTAAGFIVVGLCLVGLAWRETTTREKHTPRWLPFSVGVGAVTVALILWQAWRAEEYILTRTIVQLEAKNLKIRIEDGLKSRIEALLQTARRWEVSGKISKEELDFDANSSIHWEQAYQESIWLDPSYSVRWVSSLGRNVADLERALASKEALSALNEAKDNLALVISGSIVLAAEKKVIFAVIPVFFRGNIQGFLVTIFDMRAFLDGFFEGFLPQYNVSIFEGVDEIYRQYDATGDDGKELSEDLKTDVYLHVHGSTWRMTVWPTRESLGQIQNGNSGIVLISSLLFAVLLMLTVYFAQAAQLRAATVEAVNEKLEFEIQERKRAEELLKLTQFSVDRAGDGVIWVDTNRKILYGNDTLCNLLGYSREELCSMSVTEINLECTPERWAQDQLYLREHDSRTFEATHTAKDGTAIPVEISAKYLRYNGNDYNFSFVRDITERKRVEEELKALNESLQQRVAERTALSQQLDEKTKEQEAMIYTMSHDLRSPLINVQGFGNELALAFERVRAALANGHTEHTPKEELASTLKEDIPEALEYIHAGIARMDMLLAGLLRFSRIGRSEIHLSRLDMNEIVADIAKAFEFQMKEAGVALEIEDLPPCAGDSEQISHVFSNLLDNARKYLDPSKAGEIVVSGRQEGERSIYCVKDNGIGIQHEHQKKIFQIFHRLNTSNGTGEGLGLSIVRRILGRLNGEVWLESEPGGGSAFFVSLPTEMT